MNKNIKDDKYLNIICDILDNQEFNKLDMISHHGISRLEHSLRVSYYSYRITKLLRLNYKVTARAGLLHDFFISDIERNMKDRFLSTFTHPKYAVMNANEYFEIDDLGKNIIESHMFPIYKSLPKYAESWIVSFVDKIAALYEFSKTASLKCSYMTNLFILMILNNLR